MSHFSVLVVTDTDSEQELKAALQPYHEYECTGVEGQYVVWVDCDAETRADYEKHGDGRDLLTFASEWSGCTLRDGKFMRFTNPNKHWDWWQIGGRYSGRLRVKAGALALTGERSWTNRDEQIDGYDRCRRGDLDLDAMKKAAQDGRREWAEYCCKKAGRTMADLDIACRIAPIAHAEWMALPEPKPRGAAFYDWVEQHGGEWPICAAFRECWEIPDVPANMSLAEWIDDAPPIMSWAVVMDGQWFEKGKMGWWGISTGDKRNWYEHFNDLFGLIRADQWVSIVDCHI